MLMLLMLPLLAMLLVLLHWFHLLLFSQLMLQRLGLLRRVLTANATVRGQRNTLKPMEGLPRRLTPIATRRGHPLLATPRLPAPQVQEHEV